MSQLTIFDTHYPANNVESTETLTINRKSFTGQNLRLFTLLMRGVKLSFHDAFTVHGITDIRRRAKDLTDIGGFQISKKFLFNTRCKLWYCTPEQIEFNKNKLKK